ncbi:carbohydrate-binding protein [Streptomyces sp. NRRL B-24484]|uniref:carbohydrate-binding protein n=1 Tax=Streptomyces sp. NRRL B-24484 TaxID=1463833 RepID=UPI0007C4A32F|nr:carbohydrate-binding protein [Streptomyces sp. NRRL B-24484]
MNTLSRRLLLGGALGGAASTGLQLVAPGDTPVAAPAVSGWQLRWSPSPAFDGLRAFGTVEDDRAGSHPTARPHVTADGDAYRWTMHAVDRGPTTDRQCHGVTGMRSPAGGPQLEWRAGETWRTTYAVYVPSSLRATTGSTHLMQIGPPGDGTAPIVVQSLRRVGDRETVELALPRSGVVVGRTDLAALHDRWVDVDFRIRIGDGSTGTVRWILRSGGTTLVDAAEEGVDTSPADRVRPEWGICRPLGDTSGPLPDCHLLIRSMRGYQLVSGASGTYRAEEAVLRRGRLESGPAGTSWAVFDDGAGAGAEWTVESGAPAAATLTLRYANGGPADRPMDVAVNGGRLVAARAFRPTGGWDSWATVSLPVTLRPGRNTVRVTAVGTAGAPRLDRIALA